MREAIFMRTPPLQDIRVIGWCCLSEVQLDLASRSTWSGVHLRESGGVSGPVGPKVGPWPYSALLDGPYPALLSGPYFRALPWHQTLSKNRQIVAQTTPNGAPKNDLQKSGFIFRRASKIWVYFLAREKKQRQKRARITSLF